MDSYSHLEKLFRKTRYSLYQPEINEVNVRRLYLLKLEMGRPMTKLVNQILDEYFEQHKPVEGGDGECMSVKSVGTLSKSNGNRKGRTSTTSVTATVPSAASSMTPQ
jgi:hypothetical protein